MQKVIFLSIFICLSIHSLISQEYLIQVKPIDANSWKYADIKGNIVIDVNYPTTYQFSDDGIAAVYIPKKNLYLLIDRKGKVISTEIFDFQLKDAMGYGARGYYDGLIAVSQNKKWGCLDTAGKVAIPLKWDNITEFNEGYAIGYLNKKFYVVDKAGGETLIDIEGLKDIKHFTEGRALFIDKKDQKGFIGTDGKIAIQAQFKEAGYFKNGTAWAESHQNLVGFINNKGEWVIMPKFSNAKSFDKLSGLALVKYNNEWVYVNEKGEIISIHITEAYDDFFDGLAKGKISGLAGFYNNKGEWAIQPQFEAARDFKNGYAAVKQNGLWGIIDTDGKWVIQPKFAGIRDVVKLK